MTTTDLSKFGYREIKLTKELLTAWVDGGGLPDDFENDEVNVMFNQMSGYVFLTNSEFQVAMINPESGNLESFYTTPYSGEEGFIDELLDRYNDLDDEDREYLDEIKERMGL